MTQQEIIQDIEAYVARIQAVRQQLEQATCDKLRAELQFLLRLKATVLAGLTDELNETLSIDIAGRHQRTTLDAQRRA